MTTKELAIIFSLEDDYTVQISCPCDRIGGTYYTDLTPEMITLDPENKIVLLGRDD